ncbi:MAG: Peptidase sortase [Parcubacteria group bacterium]|nr:Peptidase sortase [Parcubacteria group bacterium]
MPKRYIVALITLAALIVFGYTLFHAVYFVPDQGQLAPTTTPIIVASGPVEQPLRLTIPALAIDAAVQQVGVNAKGNMGVPSNFTDVAWYKYGTAPGQVGSAVIDGHVDNGLALAGVFKRLAGMKPGDDIYIQTKEGHALHFKVEEVQSYAIADVPLEKVFNRADRPRLNLITCTGAWVQNQKTYDRRFVVYAVLAP